MSKILVLYYSSYGHIEQMAKAIATARAEIEGNRYWERRSINRLRLKLRNGDADPATPFTFCRRLGEDIGKFVNVGYLTNK
jgi:hypothetical protein